MSVLTGKSEISDLIQTAHTRQSRRFSFPPCQRGQDVYVLLTKGTHSLKASYSILPGNWNFLLACLVSVDTAET